MKETTIGKRIQMLRKQQGMTQEQLAERVGVSPQAVSKWENDNSCPDISILPVLASVLGVTTDMLLGAVPLDASAPQTNSGVGCSEAADGDSEVENCIELHISATKRTGVITGLLLATLGILLLLTKLYPEWFPCSFWGLAWPIAIIYLGLGWGKRIRPANVGIALFGICMLLLQIFNYSVTWTVVLALVLIIGGITYIVRQFFGKKKIIHYGKNGHRVVNTFTEENGVITLETAFGENRRCVSEPHLQSGSAKVSFGEGILDLRNVTSFADNAKLDVSVSFGELTIYLPATVRVSDTTSRHFSDTEFTAHGTPNADAPYTLAIDGSVSFGELTIRYN